MRAVRSQTLFGVGIAISVILGGAGLAPLVLSFSDSATLQNIGNLGQYISGIFAPIAFVWVVIAVLLQSKELELQRQELQETRDVLNLQKEEMKRAADENREQTKIMTENLRNEADRQIYTEVDIMLYSLALYISTNWSISHVQLGPSGAAIHIVDASRIAGSIDRNNYDRTYTFVFSSVRSAAAQLHRHTGQPFTLSQEGRRFVSYCQDILTTLSTESRYTENKLTAARLKGLQIPEIVQFMNQVQRAVIGGS